MTSGPRAVVDTTVLVSAFLTEGGVSGRLLQEARRDAFTLCLSPEIIEELRSRLLERRRIRRRYRYADERVHQHCRDLAAVAELVAGLPEIRAVERDPNDDMVIATAVAASADYLVTRDKDLLSLGDYQEIAIVTPEAFMGILRGSRTSPSTTP